MNHNDENNDKIERLGVLLYNAIVYIAEITDQLSNDPQEQLEWYMDTLGITEQELSEIGIDWFDSAKKRRN